MTFKPGQIIPGKGDTEPDEAARRARGKYATAADIIASNEAVKAFAHRALTYIYGRDWQERTDIYFVFEAIPETKSRDGYETANLHYHITFGYLLLDHERINRIEHAFINAAKEVEERLFGRSTIFYVAKVRDVQSYRKYALKHQDISRDGFDGILILSKAKRHSLSNSSRSGTAELGNLTSAQKLEDTLNKAAVATPSAPQGPNQEKLIPLEMRGASSEAISGNPLAMSLGSQKQSQVPATEKAIAERLIDNSPHNFENKKGNLKMELENNIPVYEVYISLSKGAANRSVDKPELVLFDAVSCMPLSDFSESKIGNVLLCMSCFLAGKIWAKGMTTLPNPQSAETRKKIVWIMRTRLNQLLQTYLAQNNSNYLKRHEASWKKAIELAIEYTTNGENHYWTHRKLTTYRPLNDNQSVPLIADAISRDLPRK